MHIAAKLEQILVQKDVQVMTRGEAILDSQVFRERADASRMLFVFHTKTTVLAPPVPVLGPRVPPCLNSQVVGAGPEPSHGTNMVGILPVPQVPWQWGSHAQPHTLTEVQTKPCMIGHMLPAIYVTRVPGSPT